MAAQSSNTAALVDSGPGLKVPNAETRAAMTEADEMLRARHLRFEIAEATINNFEKSGKC